VDRVRSLCILRPMKFVEHPAEDISLKPSLRHSNNSLFGEGIVYFESTTEQAIVDLKHWLVV
jgi:hypothetical protein